VFWGGLGIRAGAAFAIQAELRLLRGSVHFDPQVGPRSMFGEKGSAGRRTQRFHPVMVWDTFASQFEALHESR